MASGVNRWVTLKVPFKGLRIALSALMLSATVLEGMRFCFCSLTSQLYGQACHADGACGGQSEPCSLPVLEAAAHDCGHLTFAKLPPGDRVTLGVDTLRDLLVSLPAMPYRGVRQNPLTLLSVCRPDNHPPGAWPSYGLVIMRTEQFLC